MNKTTKYNYKFVRNVCALDATGIAVGRLASAAAMCLMGKNKADYSPNVGGGDMVEISNVEKMRWTGRKLEQREYMRHTGHPGGLRKTKVSKVFAEKPELVVTKTIYNMLPKNKLRDKMMKRIKFV